jgi:hypothetical protein
MSVWLSRYKYVLILVPVGAAGAWLSMGGHRVPVAETRDAMTAIGAATYQWQIYHGDSLCPSVRQLVDGRFLDARARKVDPWQQPFVVTCMESGANVLSFGPDRKRGTADDIVVFSPRISPKGSSRAPN